MSSARVRLAVLAACAALLGAPGATSGPDAADFALGWARGGYASPVVCRFGERVERGLRRIVIAPGPRSSAQRVLRVTFFDLGATGATRCNNELGGEERNIIGSLLVTYTPKRPRSDTPQRDVEQLIKQGPLDYPIVSGKLRVGSASAEPGSLPEVDFEGGTLLLGELDPTSDEARRLGDFVSQRHLRFDATAKDGTRIVMPIVGYEQR